jgi:hypothetical protein
MVGIGGTHLHQSLLLRHCEVRGISIPFALKWLKDSVLGIAGSVIARGARRLPADQQALVARQLEEFAFDPIVGGGGPSLIGILGPLGWVTATVGAAIALRRAGLPRVPSTLIGLSAIFAVHSWPTGSLGLAFFLLGAGWAEFTREKRVIQRPRTV